MSLVDLHLIILTLTAVFILCADHLGLQYMRGTRPTLNRSTIIFLHSSVIAGLFGMIVTGVLMAYPMWEYLMAEPAFLLKIFFILVLVCNGWFIRVTAVRASETPFKELPARDQRRMMISGMLSAIGWIGATVISFLFF